MGLLHNLVPFSLVKNSKNSFFKYFKHWHQAEMRQRPRECVWEVCGSGVSSRRFSSPRRLNCPYGSNPEFLLTGTLGQTQDFHYLNGKAVMEVAPQLQGVKHNTIPLPKPQHKGGKAEVFNSISAWIWIPQCFCLKSHAWLPSHLTTGRQLWSAGKEVFLEIHMKNHTQQDGWWDELK